MMAAVRPIHELVRGLDDAVLAGPALRVGGAGRH
jgi:hypothetical protein